MKFLSILALAFIFTSCSSMVKNSKRNIASEGDDIISCKNVFTPPRNGFMEKITSIGVVIEPRLNIGFYYNTSQERPKIRLSKAMKCTSRVEDKYNYVTSCTFVTEGLGMYGVSPEIILTTTPEGSITATLSAPEYGDTGGAMKCVIDNNFFKELDYEL